jgi:hypothetical protein
VTASEEVMISRLLKALALIPSNHVTRVIEEVVSTLSGIIAGLTQEIASSPGYSERFLDLQQQGPADKSPSLSWITSTKSLIAIVIWYLDQTRSLQVDTVEITSSTSRHIVVRGGRSFSLIDAAMLSTLKRSLCLFIEFGISFTHKELAVSTNCTSVAQDIADNHAGILLLNHTKNNLDYFDEDLLVPLKCKRVCSLLEVDYAVFAHLVFKVIVIKDPVSVMGV